MPYQVVEDLPKSVRGPLPVHAQEIFLAAFNTTWINYADWPHTEREEIAFRIAWSAVRRRYQKTGDEWVER